MKIQDLLFLPYILVWFFSLEYNHIMYITFSILLSQVILSIKYGIDRTRYFILFLLAVAVLLNFILVLILVYKNGDTLGAMVVFTLGILLLDLLAILIYIYSFILKPLYTKIKNKKLQFNKIA